MSLDGALRTILDKFGFIQSYLLAQDTPYGLQIARGLIPGTTRLHLQGYSNTQSASIYPVWATGSTYVWATADQTLTVRSASGNDANGNTGAWTVRVWWLNAAGVESTTDVVMNGVNPVVTGAITARRVNRFEVLTCGGNGVNVGDITCYWTDNATVFSRILAGSGCACDAVQTVPAGYRDVFTDFFYSNRSATGKFYSVTHRTSPTTSWVNEWFTENFGAYSGHIVLPQPLVIPAGEDYRITAESGTVSNAAVALHGYRQAV